MLVHLHVKNLALIDEIEVEFGPGLNILTGETGAGKSILLGSMQLILGGKTSRSMIRENAPYALVELLFQVENTKAKEALAALDIYPEDGQVLMSRKIMDGRSINKINGETSTVSQMKAAAACLLDIHGQHEHQSLLYEEKQLEILDAYGRERIFPEKEKVKAAYQEYRKCQAELKSLDMDEEQKFKGYLESIGDCVVVVSDDDIIKVHVHTNHPGLAFEKGLTYGSLSRMKIDNMREEHHERLIQNASNVAQTPETPAEAKKEEAPASNEPRKPYGFIAVSIGKGLGEIFKGIGADYLIEGGQTMNPSTEDMLNAIEKVNADVIYILPNNKNIILAAEQAKSLVEDKKIFVVPSKTVPQGIAALINFLPDLSPEENLENMTSEMGRIHTGQITYAVRNTNIDGMEIHEGDIMGIGDSGMLAVGQNVNETVLETLKRMVEDESELISVYFGEDVTEEDAEALVEKVQTAFPNCEVELNDGGQPIYYYLLSVE